MELSFCVIPVRCFDPLFIRVHQLVFFDGVSFSVIWAEHLLLDLKIFAVNGYNIFYIFQIPLVNAKILQTVVLASFFADFCHNAGSSNMMLMSIFAIRIMGNDFFPVTIRKKRPDILFDFFFIWSPVDTVSIFIIRIIQDNIRIIFGVLVIFIAFLNSQ